MALEKTLKTPSLVRYFIYKLIDALLRSLVLLLLDDPITILLLGCVVALSWSYLDEENQEGAVAGVSGVSQERLGVKKSLPACRRFALCFQAYQFLVLLG